MKFSIFPFKIIWIFRALQYALNYTTITKEELSIELKMASSYRRNRQKYTVTTER